MGSLRDGCRHNSKPHVHRDGECDYAPRPLLERPKPDPDDEYQVERDNFGDRREVERDPSPELVELFDPLD